MPHLSSQGFIMVQAPFNYPTADLVPDKASIADLDQAIEQALESANRITTA